VNNEMKGMREEVVVALCKVIQAFVLSDCREVQKNCGDNRCIGTDLNTGARTNK